MPWISVRGSTFLVIAIAILTLCSYTSSVESKSHFIYWNRTNTLFHRNDSSVDIEMYDNIDLLCPDYSDRKQTPDIWEYYSIYLVTKMEYELCTILNPKSLNVTKLRNCSTPGNKSRPFTLLVLPFQPVPLMPDFIEGQKYYMISTSTGTQLGMNNQINGSCRTRNMRLILNLLKKPTTVSPRPHTTHTSPTNRTSPFHTTTRRPTTTTKTTTTTTTTKPPTTTTKKPTSKFPDGTPVDPNIVIEAPGGEKNSGIINAGVGAVRASVTVTLVLALVTFIQLIR